METDLAMLIRLARSPAAMAVLTKLSAHLDAQKPAMPLRALQHTTQRIGLFTPNERPH